MTKTKLHPGARWIFRIRSYISLLLLLMILSSFLFPIIFDISGSKRLGEALICFFIYIILIIIFGEIYARMAYNRWFYEFTPTSLKLERGIIWKRYSNIPYERVQNVDIRRGIIARLVGFSTVDIQTAGFHYTGGGTPRSEGHIPAVSTRKAEEIREFLMKKISKNNQGL